MLMHRISIMGNFIKTKCFMGNFRKTKCIMGSFIKTMFMMGNLSLFLWTENCRNNLKTIVNYEKEIECIVKLC